ncbi:uncharacterized protein PEZ65_007388 [Lycodopsis pacificus]
MRFGVTAPSTVTGKVLLVFYGLLGCSATILFFNLFLERVITLLSLLIFWCHRRTGHSGLAGRASEDNNNEGWKPSVYQVTLVLFVVVLLVACGAASLYSTMEGWTYMESLYFCFVAFSTVGFGDFVSGQRERHENTWAYQVANCLLMLLGMCCTYSLFNTISVIIKQGLNWMLGTMAWMCRCIRHYRLQLRPLFKLCSSDSEPPVCYCEDDTLHRRQLQAVFSSGHRFGVTAPSTVTGKVLLVFYGLLGCSATILFFNLFLERVITLLSLLIFWCHRRTGHSGLAGRASEDNNNEGWKPSVYQVTLVLFVVVLLVACGAASLYSTMEGWTYMESLYFCFVAFSTVGFGDFVSGQRERHENTWAYQVANCLLMLLGMCCTYSLFNTISVIIKQGLNWMLGTMAWMCRCIRHYRLQLRPLFKLCSSDSEPPVCYCEDDTLHRRQLQAVFSSGHRMMWHSFVPNAIGKCLCDEAQVETVCHRE